VVERSVDFRGTEQYLTFLWTPDPRTLFSGISKLPPGHLLTFRNGEVCVREWWDISYDNIDHGRTEQWWQDQVLETMDRVVDMEMVADVPLGSFLSGGVDSSMIGGPGQKHSNGRKFQPIQLEPQPKICVTNHS